MKVALVCDYLVAMGGTERTLLELAAIFPEAPIYVLFYSEEKMSPWFPRRRIHSSFLQKFPYFFSRYQQLWRLLSSVAAETFDLRDFELVISIGRFAQGVITRPQTTHIHYYYKLGDIWQPSFKIGANYLRLWDRSAAQRPDYLLAGSAAVAAGVKKAYRREATVIYPPVQLVAMALEMTEEKIEKSLGVQARIFPDETNGSDYFLVVSCLADEQRVALVVEAFNKLSLSLVIIGDGPQKGYLTKIAGPTVRLLGWLSDKERDRYYQRCAALIFTGLGDFSAVVVEAMSWGKPVLAYRPGALEEIIAPGVNGEFFESLTPEVLADGIRRLRERLPYFDPRAIRRSTDGFSAVQFKSRLLEFMEGLGYNIKGI